MKLDFFQPFLFSIYFRQRVVEKKCLKKNTLKKCTLKKRKVFFSAARPTGMQTNVWKKN